MYNQKFGKIETDLWPTWSIASIKLLLQISYIHILYFFTMSSLLNFYIGRTFSFSSVGVGGREGAYKEMRITAYEHNQLLFFLIRRALHYSWINYFFQFQQIFSKTNFLTHLWGQWTTFCGSLGHPAKMLTDLKCSPWNIIYVLKQRCRWTWNSAQEVFCHPIPSFIFCHNTS